MDADARAGLSALQAKPTDLANWLPAGSLGKLPTTQPRCASTSSLTRQIWTPQAPVACRSGIWIGSASRSTTPGGTRVALFGGDDLTALLASAKHATSHYTAPPASPGMCSCHTGRRRWRAARTMT